MQILSFTLLALFQQTVIGQTSPLLMLQGHTESINCIAYSPNGLQLISGAKDGKIKVWNVAEGYKEKKTLTIGPNAISGLSFSHSGNMIAVGTYKKLLLYDATSLKKLHRVRKSHASFVKSVHFSADDKLIVTSSWKENALVVWNAQKLKKIIQLKEEAWTDDADFTPDGKYLVSVNHANVAKLWDVQTGNLVKIFAGHEDWLYAVKVTIDQKNLITAGLDKTIRVWDIATGKLLKTLEEHNDGVTGLSISDDNRYMASCGLDSTVLIWDITSFTMIARFKSQAGIISVAFCHDKRTIASAGLDRVISIWDYSVFLKKD